jgi:hypothetical protein
LRVCRGKVKPVKQLTRFPFRIAILFLGFIRTLGPTESCGRDTAQTKSQKESAKRIHDLQLPLDENKVNLKAKSP